MDFKKILVGIDLTDQELLLEGTVPPSTQAAIDHAVSLASQTGGEITFFAAANFKSKASLTLDEEKAGTEGEFLQNLANGVLEKLVAVAGEKKVSASQKFVDGKGWLELIRETLRGNYDVLIVGTRNKGATQRLLFGSTGLKLVRKCPCPVWIIKPTQNSETNTFLVADDFTEVGEKAIDIGVTLARHFDARLAIVHAVQYPHLRQMQRGGLSDAEVEKFRQTKKEEAENTLNERVAQTDFRTVEQGVRRFVVPGVPESVVSEIVKAESIDLLIIGTIARGGIPGLLVGNTAERILTQVNCSLLALKPADFKCPISLDG